ncbi:MAG: hypothetical protein HOV79_17605 [Hamadaea sp.]|nr:hypothetical protein [Hamadaea sp.]
MAESVFPQFPARPAGQLTSLLRDIEAAAGDDAPLPLLTFSAYQDFFRTGSRRGYEALYFRRRARLNALGAAALLVPGLDVTRLQDLLWEICDEHTWALPAHIHYGDREGWGPGQTLDLFAAETADALAEIVVGLGDRLDPLVHQRVRAEIDRRVLTPLADPRPLSWEGFGNNWESVCAGAAGMAALALEEDPQRLEAMLERCRRAMDRFLAGYGDDGGCPEGVDYWVYGFGYFVYFAEALRARTGEDLLDDPKVREIAAFPHRAALGDGAYLPFSDASGRPFLPAGLVCKLAERFGTPAPAVVTSFHDDYCHRWAHLARTLAWYRPAPPVREQLAAADFLPDLAWVVDRGALADGGAAVFAAKGGHNDEPHNHNDLGHFLLHVRGDNVLTDLGAGEYTKEYFSDGRYDSIYTTSLGHSVPVVDGCGQEPGPDRRATVLRHEVLADGVRFDLDLTSAYAVDGLTSLIRRLHWHRDGRLDLTDEVVAERPLSFEEVFISRHRPDLDGDALAQWAGAVTLTSAGDHERALDELVGSDHHGHPDQIFRLRLATTTPAGPSRHRFVFVVR